MTEQTPPEQSYSVTPVQASKVRPGDTIWAHDDGDWLTVAYINGDFTLEFHRRDGSVAEVESYQTVLKRS